MNKPKHPEHPMSLVAVFSPKPKHEPLKAGDAIRAQCGDIHRILQLQGVRRITLAVEPRLRVWSCIPADGNQVADAEAITEEEWIRLFGHMGGSRINPDGSETPLSVIYGEQEDVTVGVGSYLLAYEGSFEGTLLKIVADANELGGQARVEQGSLVSKSYVVDDNARLSLKELCAMLPVPPRYFEVIPLSNALELLAKEYK